MIMYFQFLYASVTLKIFQILTYETPFLLSIISISSVVDQPIVNSDFTIIIFMISLDYLVMICSCFDHALYIVIQNYWCFLLSIMFLDVPVLPLLIGHIHLHFCYDCQFLVYAYSVIQFLANLLSCFSLSSV